MGAIKAILDLEWTSIRPIQSVGPPVWLSGVECGDVVVQDDDELKSFEARYEKFVGIFERQENLRLQNHQSTCCNQSLRFSDIMKPGLSSGKYWFGEATGSFYGFDGLFRWALARHTSHNPYSMMTMVGSWIGRRKLGDLQALEPSEDQCDTANVFEEGADPITIATSSSSGCL